VLETVIFRSLKPDVYPDLTISVVNPPTDQLLLLRNITGIEPTPANINSKGYGVLDGEFFVNARVGKRNIVATFGLNTSGGITSVSTARTLIYGYMMTKGQVHLTFMSDDHVPVDIWGYVETLTPTRFSDDPEMQVSIICPKPYFLAPSRKEVAGDAGLDPDQTVIDNDGNLSTGIQFVLDMAEEDYVGSVILETRIAGPTGPVYQTFSLYENTYLSGFSKFWLGTEQGNKYVEAHEGSDVVNMLGKMDPGSWWMFLVQGRNWFRVRTPESDTPRGWTLSYVEQYGGI